jgi:hypothetical protein
MGNNSTKVNSLKVMQGRKAEVVKTTKTLTHRDIKEFFLKFAEAIFVDQERVNKMSRKHFNPFYDDGMWRRTRGDYLSAIVDLSLTVDRMPKRLLKNLTELAITYRPDAVKLPLFNFIGEGAASPAKLLCNGFASVQQKVLIRALAALIGGTELVDILHGPLGERA